MMGSVADNAPPPGPEGPPPGEEPTPPRGELVVPPPNRPAPLDPDEVRQFQEFKRFQELMRQQRDQGFPQGEPPPPGSLQPWGPPPPPKRGPVKRALTAFAGKVVTAVVVVLLLVVAGYLLLDHFLGGPPNQPPASQIGGGKQKTTLLFEETPRAAVQKVYDDVAQGDPENACGRFTEQARAQFTDHFGAYGASCEEVVEGLNAEVVPGEKSEYANPADLTSVTRDPTLDEVTVSSCTLGVRGGPLLGALTVSRDPGSQGGNQWIVTAHERETCSTVPAPAPTS